MKKILDNFCTIYKIICLSLSQYMNVLQNVFPWCKDHPADHHSLLTENATSLFYRTLSVQQLLTDNIARQECCINMWNLEMLINEK